MAKDKYVVTGEYITVTTATPDGPKLLGFYKGAELPSDVPQHQIDHHLAVELIRKVPAPAPPAPPAEPAEAEPARNDQSPPKEPPKGSARGGRA